MLERFIWSSKKRSKKEILTAGKTDIQSRYPSLLDILGFINTSKTEKGHTRFPSKSFPF